MLVVKNPPAKAGDTRDPATIPGSRRSPGGGNGNPLQHYCLGKPMDRGAWSAAVHRVMKSWTRLSDFTFSCIGEGNGSPLQCSCLENPRAGGAWGAAIYGVAESDTTEGTWQQQLLCIIHCTCVTAHRMHSTEGER